MDKQEALRKYEEEFGDSFPTMIIRRSDEKTVEIIEQCIREKKTAEELFNLDYSPGIFY
jgi:hypothetical protein